MKYGSEWKVKKIVLKVAKSKIQISSKVVVVIMKMAWELEHE